MIAAAVVVAATVAVAWRTACVIVHAVNEATGWEDPL